MQNTNSKATNNVFAFCVHRAPPWSSYIYCFKRSAGPLSFCVGCTELLLGPHIFMALKGPPRGPLTQNQKDFASCRLRRNCVVSGPTRRTRRGKMSFAFCVRNCVGGPGSSDSGCRSQGLTMIIDLEDQYSTIKKEWDQTNSPGLFL